MNTDTKIFFKLIELCAYGIAGAFVFYILYRITRKNPSSQEHAYYVEYEARNGSIFGEFDVWASTPAEAARIIMTRHPRSIIKEIAIRIEDSDSKNPSYRAVWKSGESEVNVIKEDE